MMGARRRMWNWQRRRISIYFNVKINQIITTIYKSTPFLKDVDFTGFL